MPSESNQFIPESILNHIGLKHDHDDKFIRQSWFHID